MSNRVAEPLMHYRVRVDNNWLAGESLDRFGLRVHSNAKGLGVAVSERA
jgi:hypothetical protein